MKNTRNFAAADAASAAAGNGATKGATAAKPVEAPKAKKTEVQILGIRADLTMPTNRKTRRGSTSKYNFDNLEVGQSIGVIGRSAEDLASTVSSQNRSKKWAVQKRDATTGQLVFNKMKQADGSEIDNPNSPVMEYTRRFFAVDVDPKIDPDGATARIWREK